MRLLIFIFLAFKISSVFCWQVDQNLLSENMPEWMQNQIAEDLKPFSQGITEAMIEKTLQEVTQAQGGEVASLVRIQIDRGLYDVEIPIPLKKEAEERLEAFLEALQLLEKITGLPNLNFLVSFSDHYDRPLFLRETKAPVFTVCKARANHRSILFPNGLWNPERAAVFDAVKSHSKMMLWQERVPIAFWRGSLSEGFYHYFDWDSKPRPILVFYSKHNPDLVDAKIIENRYFESMNYIWKKWMKENDFVAPYIPQEAQIMYRYLIAIDSTASPDSLQWQLFSGSTLLKAESTQLEWFSRDLVPYVHYVPFRSDSADLGEKIEWMQTHPRDAQIIAQNAQAFAEERLTDTSVFLFTYHLLKSYSALLN